jgi:hypothetical protein
MHREEGLELFQFSLLKIKAPLCPLRLCGQLESYVPSISSSITFFNRRGTEKKTEKFLY